MKTLCDHQGCLDFQRLNETIAQRFTVAEQVLRHVLFDDGRIAIKTGREKATDGQIIAPDSLVVAKTSLRICQRKPGECQQCDALHLCRYYVCGDCTFREKCKNPHSLASPHNRELLKRHGLQDLTEKQLFQLLLQNDPYLLPEVALPEVTIPAQQATHQDPQQPSQRNPGSPTSSACPAKPVVDADRNEICLFFIRRHCSFKEKCVRVHWHLPYRWQVLDSDGETWKDLPNMEDTEKAYCDPGHDTSSTNEPLPILGLFRFFSLQSSASPAAQAVNFMTMTYEGSPVRRLSTASSVSKPPHFILTTQWLWYWKDETGKWLEFGQGDSDTPASVTSETLENVYLADRDAEIPFSAGNHQYILHFKGKPGTPQMYQENLKYKTKREVRRRPRFMSANDVKMKVESPPLPSTSSSTAESFPPNWDKSALPDFGYKLVPLSKSVKDYNMIEMLFKRTMPQGKINSIQRIQNPSLQKDQMKVRNRGTDVNQLYLFHGTDESLIEAICEHNFDWRMCGVHGTAYGKGSYFARDASYSDRYASIKKSTNKIMFVALVLVGEYCRGSSSYVRPPPKGRSFYDSCVDNVSDPSIYVIFEKQQIYPEYYVLGNCPFGDKCNDPHSLAVPYNAKLLKKHGLQDLTEKQLFQLLLQNDPNLLPEICAYYNKGHGSHGSCTYGIRCDNLHVCQHYFQALPGAGIFAQQPSQSNSGSSSGPPSNLTSGADNNEICLYFIQGCCMFNENCNNVHWHLPYRWQVLDSDGETWKDLTNVEDIERAYCDPGHDTDQPSPSNRQSSVSPVAHVVNFMTMTYEGSPVRRLSYASSVPPPLLKSLRLILTTQWLWYWKDETGRWLEFGQGDSDTPASVTSETLENVYLADRDAEIPFSAGNHKYILHFKGKPGTPQMYQENLKYKTKREVRRRPRFVSAHDVKAKVESAFSPSSSISAVESFPSHWDKSALPDFGYKLVDLSISVEDRKIYRKIEKSFKHTMPQGKIHSIQRIQNPSLWGKFQMQKKMMKARNGGTNVKELQLFHGTDESLIDAICKENFDWRWSGEHGTVYGKGSYFARDASYSDRYARNKKSANYIMFVALVLVGEYCKGSEDIMLPPLKGNGKTVEQIQVRYDSCVDDESDPKIYAIFEKDQIYPEVDGQQVAGEGQCVAAGFVACQKENKSLTHNLILRHHLLLSTSDRRLLWVKTAVVLI
ncbi:hypothetical protein INR49_030098 [Caranx melampygus]|nr:hypothetical protein INR49_030098 [Caranx melampygus]